MEGEIDVSIGRSKERQKKPDTEGIPMAGNGGGPISLVGGTCVVHDVIVLDVALNHRLLV